MRWYERDTLNLLLQSSFYYAYPGGELGVRRAAAVTAGWVRAAAAVQLLPARATLPESTPVSPSYGACPPAARPTLSCAACCSPKASGPGAETNRQGR